MLNHFPRNKMLLISSILLFATNGHAETAFNIHDKQSELLHVTSQIQQIQQTLDDNQQKQLATQNQLRLSELKISALDQQIMAMNKQLQDEQTLLENLKKKQQVSLKQLNKQQNIVAHQLRMTYQLGQMQSLKSILNPDDINTINRHLYYYRFLRNTHLQQMADIQKTLDNYNNTMTAIAQHTQTQQLLLQQIEGQHKAQQQAQLSRQKIIGQLNQQTQTKQQQLAMLTANQKNLQTMVSHLTVEAEAAPPTQNQSFPQLRGRLQWPVDGFMHANDNVNKHRAGIIIKAPEGTPVHAIAGGKVIFANWLRGFGLLVIINHGDGYMSLYARNQAIYTRAGDVVNSRDVIAAIGDSGGFNRPSLYFEIRHHGTPLDPKTWCI